MDATLLSPNSNFVLPIAEPHRRFFTNGSSQFTQVQLGRNSELRRLRSPIGLSSVDWCSTRPQFGTKGGCRKLNAVHTGASDAADAIVLDVRGMLCEGCVASVQRILESQETVSSASVNLTTETATVWPVSDAKTAHWRKDLGQALAKHLTSCGFESNLRDQGATDEDAPL